MTTYGTNGIDDLIGRRAMLGEERVRIEEVAITEDGAIAQVRPLTKDEYMWVLVQHLRLVPRENMPDESERPGHQETGSERTERAG